MDSVQPPLHVGDEITPEQQRGLAVVGNWYAASVESSVSRVRYSGYLGYGGHASGFRQSESEQWSAGADLRMMFERGGFAGVSYYQQRLGTENQRSQRSFSVYAELPLAHRVALLGEYVVQLRDPVAGRDQVQHVDLTYTALRWQFAPRFDLSYRFNWGDDATQVSGARRYAHTLTLGFEPTPSLRFKLEYADHDFRGSSRSRFQYWAASIGGLF